MHSQPRLDLNVFQMLAFASAAQEYSCPELVAVSGVRILQFPRLKATAWQLIHRKFNIQVLIFLFLLLSFSRRLSRYDSIPVDVSLSGTQPEVEDAWRNYAWGVGSYAILIVVLATALLCIVSVMSCLACANSQCYSQAWVQHPGAVRFGGTAMTVLLFATAAFVGIAIPGTVTNLDGAY